MKTTAHTERTENMITAKIIGCAIEVHRQLGPGLLESTYEQCLAYELHIARLSFKGQEPIPIHYKNIYLDCGYRVDLFVEDSIVVELKAVQDFSPIHQAQLLTYMKLVKAPVGLLINFNVKVLKNGIKRFAL